MSAARKLSLPQESTDGSLLRLFHGYLETTGSEVVAAIFALDAHHRTLVPVATPRSTIATTEPAYLTVKQAAEQLQVSERTITRMIDRGLPVIRAGKTVRIKPADLEQHLEEQDTRFD
jgi:excisionase family DNA binding protein